MNSSKIIVIALALFAGLSLNAQKTTFTLSEYIPESGSVTDIDLFNPNFDNSFVFIMAHGATAFNQSRELYLIDSKTFAEKKKIDYPKYKGYDRFAPYIYVDANYTDNELDLNKNLILLYSNKVEKLTGISAAKIDGSLTAPEKPQALFATSSEYSVRMYKNDKKDLCLFTFLLENKKEKKASYNFRVYDANLGLLKADSVPFEYEGVNNATAYIYDNGYVLAKNDKSKLAVTIVDTKTKKTTNITLANGTNTLNIIKVKAIAGDKVVIFGEYWNMNGKKVSNGFFKATVNGSSVEEQVYFDHVPAGEKESEREGKNVERVVIADNGSCYGLISQGPTPASTYGGPHKYEVVYINNANDKWKKQVPIPGGTFFEMNFVKGALRIIHLDYEGDANKIDANNFVYGKPSPSIPVTLRQTYKSNIAILTIVSNGSITRESFVDNYYKMVTLSEKGFYGVHQGLNGQLTSKCKFFRVSFE